MNGCGSHNCYIKKPKGAGTNSGCTCLSPLDTRTRIEVERKIQRLALCEKLLTELANASYNDRLYNAHKMACDYLVEHSPA